MRGRYAEAKPIMARGPIVPDIPFCTWVVLEKSLPLSLAPCLSTWSYKRKIANETSEGTRGEGCIDNAIGGGLHYCSKALFVFIWALCSSLERFMGRKVGRDRPKRNRDERIYSENEAKGKRGPLVVTGLLCVSVEKKYAAREASARFGTISAFRRRSHEAKK